MPLIVGIHGIAQQFKGGPKLTNLWWLAMRGGLEAAGYREAADALPEADMRVVFYGDLFRPSGTKARGGPPYTVAHIEPGPELELLEEWYAEAVAQAPATGRGAEVTKGSVRATKQVMLNLLLQSPTLAGVAERAFIGDLKQVTAFPADPGIKELLLQRTAAEVTADAKVIIGHSLGSVVAYEYLGGTRRRTWNCSSPSDPR